MKIFKRNSGQQIFIIGNLFILYLCFMVVIFTFIVDRENFYNYLPIIALIILNSLLFFGAIYLALYFISKSFSKINYICYDDYLISQNRQIYYDDIGALNYTIIKLAIGIRITPLGSAVLNIILLDGTSIYFDKVSLYSYLYLKKRCKNSKSRIKKLWLALLIVPLVLLLILLYIISVAKLA